MQVALNALKYLLNRFYKNRNGLLELPLVDLSLPERQPLANQIAVAFSTVGRNIFNE